MVLDDRKNRLYKTKNLEGNGAMWRMRQTIVEKSTMRRKTEKK